MSGKIRIKAGDIIEIPIGEGLFGYARIYEGLGYRPYRIATTVRPQNDIKSLSYLLRLRVFA